MSSSRTQEERRYLKTDADESGMKRKFDQHRQLPVKHWAIGMLIQSATNPLRIAAGYIIKRERCTLSLR
jgi:hypothetical protein